MFRQLINKSKVLFNKLTVVFSKENDIYFNLALEYYLMCSYDKSKLNITKSQIPLIYFWRNSPCVIIGRHQNIWSECNLVNIKNDNVKPVRRPTGGGAVYQDLGNTCFTFISDSKNYNFNNNSKLICSAVEKVIKHKCSPMGRNDLCVDGLKFSGAAFKLMSNIALHHGIFIQYLESTFLGTLLINVNKGSLDKYLTPDRSKLVKHNIKSVKARVTNLQQFKPDTNHDEICSAIINEAVEHYGVQNKDIIYIDKTFDLNDDAFTSCYNKLTDENWIYGNRHLNCKVLKNRFDFGGFEFCIDVNDSNIVEGLWIYSDCLNADFIDYLNVKFNTQQFEYTNQAFIDVLNDCGMFIHWPLNINTDFPDSIEMIQEIKNWFTTVDL